MCCYPSPTGALPRAPHSASPLLTVVHPPLQGCAAGFLVLGALRLTNSILPAPKHPHHHHHHHHHKKGSSKEDKGGKEGTDKQPLLPETTLTAAEINC